LRGKNKFLVAVGSDSKEIEILDLDKLDKSEKSDELDKLDKLDKTDKSESGFRVLTELPLRYGLSGASVAAHGDNLVRIMIRYPPIYKRYSKPISISKQKTKPQNRSLNLQRILPIEIGMLTTIIPKN
jgi:hypothetical protein